MEQEPEPSFLPEEVVSSPVPDAVVAPTTVEVALCNGHRVAEPACVDTWRKFSSAQGANLGDGRGPGLRRSPRRVRSNPNP